MLLSRTPSPRLAPFVALLWAHDPGGSAVPKSGRERVLPTGAMHLVIRLTDAPLRLFRDAADPEGFTVGGSIVGGARAAPYVKDVSRPTATVGAALQPGAAGLLLGAPGGAFSHVHTRLDDVWGAAAVASLEARLGEEQEPARRLDMLEAALAARLPQVRGIDPMIAHALVRMQAEWSVGAIVADIGCSHRHFTTTFRAAVGLGPKSYARVQRFGRAVRHLAENAGADWADLAAAEGYADQAHLTREFRAFAGITPGNYRRLAPMQPHHVPIAG